MKKFRTVIFLLLIIIMLIGLVNTVYAENPGIDFASEEYGP